MAGVKWVRRSSGITVPEHVGTATEMRPEESLINAATAPFDPVAAFGADLWGFWLSRDAVASGANLVSLADRGPGSHALLPIASHVPIVNATGSPGGGKSIACVKAGGGDSMQCEDLTLELPLHLVICMRWTVASADYHDVFSGASAMAARAENFDMQSYTAILPNAVARSNGNGPNVPIPDGQWHVLSMYVSVPNGSNVKTIKASIDDGATITGTVNSSYLQCGGFTFGNKYGYANYTDADFVGAMMVKREMTPAELTSAVSYLQDDAGLP